MKKNAFTLVELLGVLVIVSILSMLIIPNVSKYVNKFREDSYNDQVAAIELAAKNWAIDNPGLLPVSDGVSINVTIGKLKEGGYLELSLKNPQTGENFPDSMTVSVTKYGKGYKYEFVD